MSDIKNLLDVFSPLRELDKEEKQADEKLFKEVSELLKYDVIDWWTNDINNAFYDGDNEDFKWIDFLMSREGKNFLTKN